MSKPAPHVPTTNGATLRSLNGPALRQLDLTSSHRIRLGDARDLAFLDDCSVHLVVTSPPYFNLKKYDGDSSNQLGDLSDYQEFLAQLDRVWAECARVLVPGGRVCCVVGAVNVARREGGRHYVLPLPSDIQVRSRQFGLDNLTPIIWLKVANIKLEASTSSRFLGKPNLPNGVIKNDFETIVMLRKPGGYRKPTPEMETASRIENEDYFKWFVPIWSDVTGASTRNHPAPFPVEIAYRLIRMFSFVGDRVLDPLSSASVRSIQRGFPTSRTCPTTNRSRSRMPSFALLATIQRFFPR
ncbi:MAG: DNA methyltransferase [Dehalococcoidia bacterium]